MPKMTDRALLREFLKTVGYHAGFGDITSWVVSILLELDDGPNFELGPALEWLNEAAQKILKIRDELERLKARNSRT
jgi:hypothetical protein